MKKLFIVSIAVIMCLALTLPAVAEVKMSGGVNFLAYYYTGSPETQTDARRVATVPGFASQGTPAELAAYGEDPSRGVGDRKTFQMNLSALLTSLRATYTNQKGTYGATIGVYMGQINNWPTNWEIQTGATYMWWNITPTVKLSVGKISQFIGGVGPSSLIEHNEYERDSRTFAAASGSGIYADTVGGVPVAGLTSFGRISTTSIPGAEIDFKVNDMVTVKFGIMDPDDDGTPGITLASNAGGSALEQITFPRLDLSVPIRWGNIYIQPKGSYIKRKYQNVIATSDDSFDCWLIGVDGTVQFGPLQVLGQYTYGKNIGANNYSGPGSTSAWPQVYTDTAGYTHIEDVTDNAWCFQLRWQATPKIAVQGGYGQWVGKSDVNPVVTYDDYHYKRSGWVANLWYSVGPNFFIIPSYSHLNLGQDVRIPAFASDTLEWDYGSVNFYGVGFYMIF